MGARDLNLTSMAFAYLLLLLPLAIIYYMKIKLVKETLLSVVRMSLQLGLVGIYLKYIFKWDNLWLNLAWLFLMILVSTFSIIKSNSVCKRLFFLPIMGALAISLFLNIAYFNYFIVNISDIFNAKYLIPISGMLLGNSLKGNIIATNTFFDYFKNREKEYFFTLSLEASRQEALRPVVRESIKRSLRPTLASIATIGLVSLPGMMTGQILGGSVPMTAIKYQIAIMIAIFSTMAFSIFLVILFLKKVSFNKFDVLKKYIFIKGEN
jgi:putative ABC transport system permease protein